MLKAASALSSHRYPPPSVSIKHLAQNACAALQCQHHLQVLVKLRALAVTSKKLAHLGAAVRHGNRIDRNVLGKAALGDVHLVAGAARA